MIGITTGKIMNSPYNHQFSYDHHNHYKVKSMFKMIWIKKYDGLLCGTFYATVATDSLWRMVSL